MTDTPTSNTSTLWQKRDIQELVVAHAENDFGRVQQSLNTPKVANKLVSHDLDHLDLEKGRDGDRQETFDLREYLTSSNDANSAAGIRHKHVGVTWEDLEVLGIGGEENKVRHRIGVPLIFVSQFTFARSTSPHTQVSHFVLLFLFYNFFLTFWTDAVAELVTFPFTVLRNALQPIIPKKLLQTPPIRRIIHKCVFQVGKNFPIS